MSSYSSFYSTDPKTHTINTTLPQHPPVSDPSKKCPVSFAHRCLVSSESNKYEYQAPQKGDVRSVCPALNTMANHGYIPRDGRNLTFFTICYGLQACYGLSLPLALFLTLGGFLAISRFPITLPFKVPRAFQVRNPDGSRSQPGVIDLRLVGRHNRVEHDASLVHDDCPVGSKYPNPTVREEMVAQLVGDVLPRVERPTACASHIKDLKEDDADMSLSSATSIISRLGIDSRRRRSEGSDASSSSETVVSDDEDEQEHEKRWRQYATRQYLYTLVSAADVGRMRARREREISPKKMDWLHAELARGEMAIMLGVWERSAKVGEDDEVKKGIPLPYLLTWLAEERLPEGWKPDHVQGLWNVTRRSKAIKAVADAIVKAKSY